MLSVGGLFDGCGLLAYGLHLAGLEHRWLCEVNEFRQGVLRQRFPGVPVYPDVRAVGADAPRVDVIAGGFPCKGASSAGKREGFGHPETVLWFEMLRVVRELRPRYVLVENVADLLSLHRGEVFGEVVGGLAEVGYDAEWDCFPAAAFGATHLRDRVFITAVADTGSAGWQAGREPERAELAGIGYVADEVAAVASHADERSGEARGAQAGEEGAGRPVSRRGREVVADAERGVHGRPGQADVPRSTRAGEGEGPQRQRLRSDAADGTHLASDADDDGRSRLARPATGRNPVHGDERDDVDGRSVRVGWGAYEPAIRRWEEIVGRPSPEPLLRRVDDGPAARVERSRLSALGDGVLVQAGWLCGRRILEYEGRRAA